MANSSTPKNRNICFMSSMTLLFQAFLISAAIHSSQPYSIQPTPQSKKSISRASFFQKSAGAAVSTFTGISGSSISPSVAEEKIEPKLENISDDKLKEIITADVVERKFLASADLTRSVYDESSIFTDEIDR